MLNILKTIYPFLPRDDSGRLQTKAIFIKNLNMLSNSSCQLFSFRLTGSSILIIFRAEKQCKLTAINVACPLHSYMRD